MSSSSEANYARIGAFVLLGAILIFVSLLYLAGMEGKDSLFNVETYFPNDASGLAVGSDITFRGVKVGSVKTISFVGVEYADSSVVDRRKIYVQFVIDARMFKIHRNADVNRIFKLLVADGLHATVSSSGITGLSHIELNFLKDRIVDEPISWTPRLMFVPPAPSILESASDAARRILAQIDAMDLNDVWTNVVYLTSHGCRTLDEVNTLFETQGGNISEILTNLRDASAAIRDITVDLRENPSRLIWPSKRKDLPETAQ